MPEDLCACDQSAPVDLDTWRAEAGEAIALCAYPPTAPFPITATVSTMAAAARTGWPRDAARVGVLCAEVERLRAALLGAADFIAPPLGSALPFDDLIAASKKAAALRALAAGGAPAPVVAADAVEPCPGSRGW